MTHFTFGKRGQDRRTDRWQEVSRAADCILQSACEVISMRLKKKKNWPALKLIPPSPPAATWNSLPSSSASPRRFISIYIFLLMSILVWCARCQLLDTFKQIDKIKWVKRAALFGWTGLVTPDIHGALCPPGVPLVPWHVRFSYQIQT